MNKNYKIGELSKLYKIGRDSIKYYEELEILKPKRDKNGYRLYTIEDVCKLNIVRELRELDIPVKDIKNHLEKRDIISTKKMLEEEIDIISKKINQLMNQRKNIEERINAIEQGENQREFNKVSLKYYKERKAVVIEGNMDIDENTDYLIQKLKRQLEDNFYILGNNNIASIFDTESVDKGIFNKYKNVLAFMDDKSEVHNFNLEEGSYLSLSYKGAYENNRIYLPMLYEYANENGYTVVSDPLEIYDIDISETNEIEEFITRLEVRVSV